MNFEVSNISYMFLSILLGIVITLITSWIGIRLARKFNLMDIPGIAPHKKHAFPMPYAGGIALVLSLAILAIFVPTWQDLEIRWTLLFAIIVFLFGIGDDARQFKPIVKLLGQALAAILLILSGTYIEIFETSSFFIGGQGAIYFWIDRLLTFLWIVGVTNAFNLVDSMDGLSVGLGAWALAFFMLATYDSQQHFLSIQSALLLGICVTIHYFNASPARFFLGDSGAQTLGFILASFSIIYTPLDKAQMNSWFIPILLVGVPIFDTSLVFFSRLRRHTPFYKGSLDHTYHRLVKLGLDSNRAVLTMHLAALMLDCLAFIAVSMSTQAANGILVFCILMGIGLFIFLDQRRIIA